MKSLEPPDIHHLSSASGWFELGDLEESKAALALISHAEQNHPDVLEMRWLLSAREEHWATALEIARQLIKRAPERSSGWLHQAYALRRVSDGGVRQAWLALLPAFDKFPNESIISYNLSCYACQMKQFEAARVWFKRATVIGGKEKIKKLALDDADLEPLWEEIRRL